MKGFIIDPTYKIEGNKAFIYFYGKLENGESFLTINETKPYFYIKQSDLKKAKETKTVFEYEEGDMKDFHEKEVVKIILDVPQMVHDIRKEFEGKDIVCYEADIRFVYRTIIDKNILGCIAIEGEYEKTQYINRVYKEPTITPAHFEPTLTVLSFDLETSMKADIIFSISIVAKNYTENKTTKKVLLVSDKPVKHAICFKTEKEMLQEFISSVQTIDPDIVTGWNVVDFDFKVLRDRCKNHKIPFVIGRSEEEIKVRIESQFMKDSSVSIVGRQVLDGIALLKNSFVKLEDYKLDTAAHEIIGKKKAIAFNTDKGAKIEELFKKNPEALVGYNLKDSELVLEILEKKDLINLVVKRSMLTGMQIDRVSASIASLDSLYIRETRKRGYVCNSLSFTEREERIKGGFVRESTPGIYDSIIVCDFKSLYPSIIRTFNVDPLCFQKDGTVVAPNGAKFRNDDGILPELIHALWQQRDAAKKKKDAVASGAIKITMNSFYGVLASPMCRFYNPEMAGAITSWGQMIVKETAQVVETMGYTVIYGDTDSIFVETKAGSYTDAHKIGEKIALFITNHFEKRVKNEYNRKSYLELEFEKVYSRFVMPNLRGTDVGAKKRYAGMITDGKTEHLDIVGLETVRKDWTDCAKEFQMTLLKKIFAKQEVAVYIKKFVDEVKSGKHDTFLMYKKTLSKDLTEYTKITPPHVKAARMLDKIDSHVIEYYITVNGPEPVQKLKSKIDYDHYIEKQLKPIADSLLVFFNQNFDDVVSGKRQKSLFEY
ncbi:MAG: DNA polymerase II [Candidatus Woesearchaeota archaeon]